MLTPMRLNGTSFKLNRPNLTARSNLTDLDPYAKQVIEELDNSLSQSVWPEPAPLDVFEDPLNPQIIGLLEDINQSLDNIESLQIGRRNNLKKLLRLLIGRQSDSVIEAKRDLEKAKGEIPEEVQQKIDYFIKELSSYERNQTRAQLSSVTSEPNSLESWLSEDLVDLVPKLNHAITDQSNLEQVIAKDGKTSLLYEVQGQLNHVNLLYNAQILLKRKSLLHYLFAFAVYHLKLTDPSAITTFIYSEDDHGGIRRLYEYIVIEAAKDFVKQKKVEVGDPDNPVELINAIGPELKGGNFSFQKGIFEPRLKHPIYRFAFDQTDLNLIQSNSDALGLDITTEERDFLIQYFKKSRVKLTPSTAPHLIPIALTQHRNASLNVLVGETTPTGALDFSVKYHTESQDSLVINTNNVLCAAQLFYVMSLGDELGIFIAMDLLIAKYLSGGRVDIQSPQVLRDLQNYVLNDEFPDLQTGRIFKRTNTEERRMFYRQVFNFGDSDLAEGMISNPNFEQYWNVLMIEVVKYIDKIENSERPESFVSRQNVAQAIEDLQYNLSTHSSGMAKVMAPVMYKELDFLIERIFKHEEIVTQLALHNSRSYWKVIERILQEYYQQSINITALQKKAMYGHQILKAIAEYTPSIIDDDDKFSNFISLAEAFIITSEQLEEAQPAGLFESEMPSSDPDSFNGFGGDDDDWNF